MIPEFATNGKEVVTVEQLLTHTSRVPDARRSAAGDWADRERRLEAFAKWRLNWEPGTARVPPDLGALGARPSSSSG